MGLIADLDYEARVPSGIQSLVGRIAGTSPAARVMAPLLHWLDRVSHQVTGGRGTLSSWAAGQEIIWLWVAGRHSGRVRRVPLIPFPIGEDLAVVGSNFGRPGHPGWVLNLEANPEVQAEMGKRRVPAQAREAGPEEAEAVWLVAGGLFPGYARYRSQVTNRPIKVFILESRRRLPSSE